MNPLNFSHVYEYIWVQYKNNFMDNKKGFNINYAMFI